MRKPKLLPRASQAKSQIKDFIDDEKSLGRATKSQIAAAIGIQPSHFSNLLNGRNEWKLTQLEKLADFLEVPISRLFEARGAASSPGEDRPIPWEDRIIRVLRHEARSLRSGLRTDLGDMLRDHVTDLQAIRSPDYATDEALTDYPEDHLPGALAIEIRDLDASYDRKPAGAASESLWFRRDWLRRHGLDAAQCMIIRMQGDAMERTLPHGCSVLVNRGQRQRRVGRIYVLRTAAGLVVGRAGRDSDGGWLLERDHPDGKAAAWPDGAEIIGQVRWMARTL